MPSGSAAWGDTRLNTLHYYFLLDPPPSLVIEDEQHPPAWEVTLKFRGIDGRVALFVSDGTPMYARISVPGFEGPETKNEDAGPFIQICQEHLLTCLWFTYDRRVRAFAASLRTFLPETDAPRINTRVDVMDVPGRVVPEQIRFLFAGTIGVREEMRLLQDGSDERLPLQYRYLSLYKLLELSFRRGGRWDYAALRGALEAHGSDFVRLAGGRSAVSYLHDLRDRCAHIRTGRTGQQAFGVTHLRHDQAMKVEKALAPLKRVCQRIFNVRAGGNFWIGEEPPPAGWQPTHGTPT